MGPRGLAALVIVAAWLSACGDGPRTDVADSSSGASLFESLDRAQADAAAARGQLTTSQLDTLQRGAEAATYRLLSDSWSAVEELDPETSSRLLTGVAAAGPRSARRWEARAPVDPTLPLGRPWLALDGRRLRSHGERADGRLAWRDPSVPLLVWWDPAVQRLLAVSEERPAALELGFDTGLGPDPSWWAGARTRGVRRLTLGDETRRVIAVATPGVLGWELGELRSAALDVGAALADLGISVVDGELRPRTGPQPTVRFAVDVVADGRRARAWSRELAAGEGFVDARVDLTRWRGRACRLELVTEAADEQPAGFAVWSTPRFRDAEHGPPTRPHLVVIDIDTLRADGLGCYGNPRDSSPRLDAWAAREALRFSDAIAVNNWTLPSTASLLTGLPVGAHGVLRFPLALDERHRPVALRLAEVGYETRAITDGGFVVPEHGFAVGFDRFEVRRNARAEFARVGWDAALEAARRHDAARPLFLFLQTYEVHTPFPADLRYVDADAPYDGPLAGRPVTKHDVEAAIAGNHGRLADADRRYLRALYDAGVRRADAVVGRFLETLPEVFAGEPYAVVITSDHGEELGERGSMGHGTTLHAEQLRVPLLVRPPHGEVGGRVIDAPVSGLDLVPTLLTLAGLPRDSSLPGRDLLARLPDDALRVARHDERAAAALRLGWKLVEDRTEPPRPVGVGLYDHAVDPSERDPLPTDAHPRAATLRASLREWERDHPLADAPESSAAATDSAHLEALGELGYLDGG